MGVNPDRRREWIKSRRNKRKQARRARYNRQLVRYTVLLMLLACGWCGFSRVPWKLGNGVEDITVHGNSVVTVEQVRQAARETIVGKPLYKVDPRQVERRIMALADVKYAFVRRYSLPQPRMVIEVLEEFPWATYSPEPDAPPEAVIAQSGRMIPIKDFPGVSQPFLKIYGGPNLKMTGKDVTQWSRWCAFIAEQTGEPVLSVDLRRPYDVRVQDGDLNLKLGTADGTLTRRLGRLTSILTAIEPIKGRLEYVDLGLDNNIPLKVAKRADGQKATLN